MTASIPLILCVLSFCFCEWFQQIFLSWSKTTVCNPTFQKDVSDDPLLFHCPQLLSVTRFSIHHPPLAIAQHPRALMVWKVLYDLDSKGCSCTIMTSDYLCHICGETHVKKLLEWNVECRYLMQTPAPRWSWFCSISFPITLRVSWGDHCNKDFFSSDLWNCRINSALGQTLSVVINIRFLLGVAHQFPEKAAKPCAARESKTATTSLHQNEYYLPARGQQQRLLHHQPCCLRFQCHGSIYILYGGISANLSLLYIDHQD